MRYTHSKLFDFAKPVTTRTYFRSDEKKDVDYKQVTESEFKHFQAENLFLFCHDVEEYANEDREYRFNPINPIMKILNIKQEVKQSPLHCWKMTGVLTADVDRITDHGKVALIECEL